MDRFPKVRTDPTLGFWSFVLTKIENIVQNLEGLRV